MVESFVVHLFRTLPPAAPLALLIPAVLGAVIGASNQSSPLRDAIFVALGFSAVIVFAGLYTLLRTRSEWDTRGALAFVIFLAVVVPAVLVGAACLSWKVVSITAAVPVAASTTMAAAPAA